MFVVAITRTPAPAFAHDRIPLTTTSVELGPWTVTAATDGRLARCVRGGITLEVCESPVNSSSAADVSPLSRVTIDLQTRLVVIDKPMLSGRPIFYHLGADGSFVCATHVSLMRAAGVKLEAAEEHLPEFFAYRLVAPPATLWQNIRQLLPSTRASVAIGDGACRIVSVSNVVFPPSAATGKSAAVTAAGADVLGGLEQTLAPFAGQPERVAVLLSGGVDSSILYRLAAARLGTRSSYSASFLFDTRGIEEEYARSAAAAMQSEHHVHTITTADYLASTVEAIDEAEEPIVVEHSGAFTSLFRAGIPTTQDVILQGQGADCFFGLKHHHLLMLQERYGPLWRVLASPGVYHLLRRASHATGRFGAAVEMVNRSRRGRLAIDDPRHLIWSLNQYGDIGWACAHFRVTPEAMIANRLEALSPYRSLSDFDLITLLDLITDVAALQNIWSKIGERHGRTLIYNFSSPAVIDAAARLDWPVKIAEPKAALRDVARRIGVPEFILTRPKSGFGISGRDWALPGGLFQPLVEVAARAFDRDILRQHQSTDISKRFALWNMVNFAIWKRRFIDGDSLESLLGEVRDAAGRQAPGGRA
jgi:asparagine synthetase B (glutamine-hydrolysing)